MSTKLSPGAVAANARIRGYMLGGFVVVFLLIGGFGVWAARTELAGAVIAGGVVVVDSSVKKVQHPTGGVVGQILVKNGDKVRAGDLVLRLDETVTRANLQMVSKQLDELMIREARLKAERDSLPEMTLPAEFAARKDEPAIVEIVNGEGSLFQSRKDTREGQKAQLKERIAQLNEEYAGVAAQITSKAKEIELIGKELGSLEGLEEKQLVTTAKMMSLRREAARLEGEHGQLRAAAAQTKGKIAEIELQILRIDQEFRTDLVQELRENQSKQAELVERRVSAEDQLKRVDIRAPQSGTIHQLAVHTVGGVINPGEPIMLVVPEGDKLVIEARVAPHDIEQVLQSHDALIRFSAFNQRTTPELRGLIRSISADLTQDQRTGESYFLSRIEIPDAELERLGEHNKLVPGMPADVQIKTQSRTALSYLLKPMQDQLAKAFKER
jgi:HlyD family secretion protein